MTLAKKAFSFLKNSFNLTKKLTLNLSDNPSDFSISHKIARFKQENEGQICNFFLLYFKKSGKYWNKLTRSSGWLFEWSCQRRTFIRHFCSVTAQFKLSNSNRPNHVHKSQNYNFPKNPLKKSGKKGFVLNFYSVARTFFCEKAAGRREQNTRENSKFGQKIIKFLSSGYSSAFLSRAQEHWLLKEQACSFSYWDSLAEIQIQIQIKTNNKLKKSRNWKIYQENVHVFFDWWYQGESRWMLLIRFNLKCYFKSQWSPQCVFEGSISKRLILKRLHFLPSHPAIQETTTMAFFPIFVCLQLALDLLAW